jgi:hypothetical protein
VNHSDIGSEVTKKCLGACPLASHGAEYQARISSKVLFEGFSLLGSKRKWRVLF